MFPWILTDLLKESKADTALFLFSLLLWEDQMVMESYMY